jgi:hypothetical protein
MFRSTEVLAQSSHYPARMGWNFNRLTNLRYCRLKICATRRPAVARYKKFELASCFAAFAVLLMIITAPAPAAVVMGTGLNFTASTLGVDSIDTPPDCDGAVGPTNYVEFINGRFAVFDKRNAVRVQSLTNLLFWRQAGVTIPANWDVTDTRLIYDPTCQRWFAAEIDFDTTGTINSNHFLVAVSTTIDPTGPWKGFAVTSDPTVSTTADFPTLGLDAHGVYVSGDMFDASGNLVSSTLISIPKTNLLAATPSVANFTRFSNLALGTRGIVLQSAIAVDGTAGGNVLSTASLGVDLTTGNFVTNTSLITFVVSNAAGPGTASLGSSSILTVPGYTAPIDPAQPDPNLTVDNGDARFSGAVYRVNNVLYAVHNTEIGGRAAVRWYRISATNAVVLESGTIVDPALDLFYPSIAASTNGTLVIACNGCSSTSFISCYATVGETIKGVTRFGNLLLLKAGSASYDDGSGGTSRWGDYSSTCVDPADPTTFWTIQMYPSSASQWSTQITQLLTTQLRLNIAKAGTNIDLSWTSFAGAAQLEATATPALTNSWSVLTPARSTNSSLISVQLPATPSPRFFRLKL